MHSESLGLRPSAARRLFVGAPVQVLAFAALVGLIATFSAPWFELRGSFASWRIVEYHTFWRGQASFQLGDVVAPDFTVPIEFATTAMQNELQLLVQLGYVLGAWHAIGFAAVLGAIALGKEKAGSGDLRTLATVVLIGVATVAWLYLFAQVFALPSSRSLKVDFRTPEEVHTDSLIWSSLVVLPVAPMLAALAAGVEILTGLVAAREWRRSLRGAES